MIRCLIDTDPGLDDAIAILFALRHPGLDVAALTTVAGNIGLDTSTYNAGRVAALAGARVPVHPGAAAPLRREARPTAGIHGADGLGGVPFPDPLAPPEAEAAADAVARLLRAGPLELHCLGPLTNLAALLDRAPDAAFRITRVIAMGGAVDEPGNVGPRAEFNLAHDPEAAARVLSAGMPLTLIPLDATRRLRADGPYLARLRATAAAPAVAAADLLDSYFAATADQARGDPSRPLHDPCVPLLALRPDLFRLERRRLRVDGDGALVPGPHEVIVAMGLDADALRAVLLEGLAA